MPAFIRWNQCCSLVSGVCCVFPASLLPGKTGVDKAINHDASMHSHLIEELWVQKSQRGEEGWSAEAKQRLSIQLSVCTMTHGTIPKPARKSKGNFGAYLLSVKGQLSCFNKQTSLGFFLKMLKMLPSSQNVSNNTRICICFCKPDPGVGNLGHTCHGWHVEVKAVAHGGVTTWSVVCLYYLFKKKI